MCKRALSGRASAAGKDIWTMLSSALELLQWKTDIVDSHKLLEPLSHVLKFLADQLRDMDPAASEEEDDEAVPAVPGSRDSHW